MSDYVVILNSIDSKGKVVLVKASNFGGLDKIKFSLSGGVSEFTYESTLYMDLYNVNSNIFNRYAEKSGFELLDTDNDKKVTVNDALLKIEFKQYGDLIKAEPGDIIVDYLIDTSNPSSTTICYKLFQWVYSEPYIGPVNPTVYVNPQTNCTTLPNIPTNSEGAKFHERFLNYSLGPGVTLDPRLVKEIAILLNSVKKEIIDSFDGFINTGLDQGIFNFYQNGTGSFTLQEFQNYKRGLETWLRMFKEYKIDLVKFKDNAEKLYLIAFSLMRYNMLEALTVEEKIAMLKVFAKGTIMGSWTKAFSTTQYSEELIVIGICNAVTATQINDFMELLIKPYDVNKQTIFEALDHKIDGDNKKELFKLLLKYWTLSKYNPYLSNGDLEDSRLSQYVYNEKAPYTLEYQSSEFLGIYLNNFKFEFSRNENKIIAKESVFVPNTYGQTNYSPGKFDWEDYGHYTIYQPVLLLDRDFETTVKLPVLGNEINSLVPIFFIKYVDDTNDWESFTASVGLFVDIALTFSGIGNLAKLRHLRNMTRLAMLSTAVGAFDIILAAVELMFRIATDNCNSVQGHENASDSDSVKFCKRFQKYLFALQIATAVADLRINYLLKKSARRLQEIQNLYPNSLTQECREIINGHASGSYDNLAEFLEATKKNILDRIQSKASEFNRFHFSNQQLNDLIDHALDLRMNPAEIEAFIVVACKNAPKDKTILFNDLKIQMSNWKNTIEPRNYPYRFNDVEEIGRNHFKIFKEKLKQLLEDFDLPTDDVRIGGSSLRKTDAGDIDCYIFMTREQAEIYTERIKEYAKKHATDAKTRNYYKNGWSKPFKQDKIIYGNYIVNEKNGQKILEEAYAREMLKDTNFPSTKFFESFEITIIIKDEALELYPYIKLNF